MEKLEEKEVIFISINGEKIFINGTKENSIRKEINYGIQDKLSTKK